MPERSGGYLGGGAAGSIRLFGGGALLGGHR